MLVVVTKIVTTAAAIPSPTYGHTAAGGTGRRVVTVRVVTIFVTTDTFVEVPSFNSMSSLTELFNNSELNI